MTYKITAKFISKIRNYPDFGSTPSDETAPGEEYVLRRATVKDRTVWYELENVGWVPAKCNGVANFHEPPPTTSPDGKGAAPHGRKAR